jgi:hypothetical protein
MDRIVDHFTERVDLVHSDGSRSPAGLYIEERIENGEMLYTITLLHNGRTVGGRSERGFFHALQNLRLELEKDNILLHCFGASEDVYPSGMQVSMGPASSAYRMRLGEPALRRDIVWIFASDDSVKPATVQQQEQFERWFASLSDCRAPR